MSSWQRADELVAATGQRPVNGQWSTISVYCLSDKSSFAQLLFYRVLWAFITDRSCLKSFVYYISVPFLYLASIMPFWLLYLVSDAVFVVLYHIIRYRREVVARNLGNAFPEKSPEEIRKTGKAFYRYLCDMFLETFKTLTISKRSMEKRCVMDRESVELFQSLAARNESIIIVMGHQGNWEWGGNIFSLLGLHQLFVIYHPLRNPHFDGLMRKMRGRFGTKLIARDQTVREMIKNKPSLTATAFIADQSPPKENAFWMTFLNQDTAVFLGTEKLARKMDYPVVFVSVARQGRRYSIHAERLPFSKDDPQGTLTVAHTRKLEEHIRRQPETWLWSHKRWKHSRPA